HGGKEEQQEGVAVEEHRPRYSFGRPLVRPEDEGGARRSHPTIAAGVTVGAENDQTIRTRSLPPGSAADRPGDAPLRNDDADAVAGGMRPLRGARPRPQPRGALLPAAERRRSRSGRR